MDVRDQEQQVEQRPEAVAVAFEERQLSYGQLNEQANQLAHYLSRLGVGPEVCVGLCLERSLEAIICLLAILKAGGAYVPLDPTYPAERLAFLVQDAHVPLVLTQRLFVEKFTTHLSSQIASHALSILPLELCWPEVAQEPSANPSREGSLEQLAYVMYPSGATGQPKGVCIPQQAVIRLVAHAKYAPLSSADRGGHVSNTSFDVATFEVGGALLNEATLVGVSLETSPTAHPFAAFLRTSASTVPILTPALSKLLARLERLAFASLSPALFGGEGITPRWIREILSQAVPGRLLRLYSPIENITFSTWSLISHLKPDALTLPIGHSVQ